MISQKKYWILISLTYLTLIYSTSLHYAFGYERTIGLPFYVVNYPDLQKHYPDSGMLVGIPLDYQWRNIWKLSSFSLDCGYYLIQTNNFGTARPPYKYRILPPLIARAISSTLRISAEMSFVIMNILSVFFAAILFTIFLLKDLKFSRLIAFIGGMLFVTMVAVTRTIPFPMLDPISLLFSILIFISVIRKNPYLFLISSVAGVLSKEVLVISALMWFIETLQVKNKVLFFKNIALSVLPILVVMITRISLGGSPLEVGYGHNILKGEFPPLWRRLISFSGWEYMIRMSFLSFSFLWIGMINLRRNKFLKRQGIIIPIIILVASVFSMRITRPLGILFPIVIPAFLLFFEE